ncbi:hypothetical protein CYMTET_39260 [Cymbomonas tetramitiformis]|uniref:Protein kinase domain-containing protein n=1 Tax=Cymbomonas tetramitiformis TaxID=36881 RepID=A0AAE0F4N5_9CHLO|nr:hypothetical protein CYMTET_39260 [Cymbomonas tetramitiformis]|eukprot:gene24515-29817_t
MGCGVSKHSVNNAEVPQTESAASVTPSASKINEKWDSKEGAESVAQELPVSLDDENEAGRLAQHDHLPDTSAQLQVEQQLGTLEAPEVPISLTQPQVLEEVSKGEAIKDDRGRGGGEEGTRGVMLEEGPKDWRLEDPKAGCFVEDPKGLELEEGSSMGELEATMDAGTMRTEEVEAVVGTMGTEEVEGVAGTMSTEEVEGMAGTMGTEEVEGVAGTGHLHDAYKVLEELGTGATSSVCAAVDRATGAAVAVKTVQRQEMVGGAVQLEAEIMALQRVGAAVSPHVLQLVAVFEEEATVHLVTERCTGDDLLTKLELQGALPEAEAALVTGQLLQGLEVVHAAGVIHRDLKLENLMFKEAEEGTGGGGKGKGTLKIIDFGSARVAEASDRDHDFGDDLVIGTLEYAAPEVLRAEYCEGSDMWAVGVLVYILLCGAVPFDSEPDQRCARYEFDADAAHVSTDARDFIAHLLVVESSKRLTASKALTHPWLTTWLSSSNVEG